MKKKKTAGFEVLKRRYGLAFVSPWIFGVIVFVLMPLCDSFRHSFSMVSMGDDGLEASFAGLKHYKYLLTEDPWYTDFLTASLSGIFTSLPIIVALSLIFAIILNQQFRGRMLMRAVFFLPVIFACQVVMSVMNGDSTHASMSATLNSVTNGSNSAYMNAIDFTAILSRLNLPTELNNLFENYLSNTFNLVWSCGVQTLLFIAGLQTIPSQLYEVGRVEGATAWESFWYITVPMLSNVILLVIFYTMIELFITKSMVVNEALNLMMYKSIYDESAARLWLYFGVVGVVMAAVFLLYRLLVQKRFE